MLYTEVNSRYTKLPYTVCIICVLCISRQRSQTTYEINDLLLKKLERKRVVTGDNGRQEGEQGGRIPLCFQICITKNKKFIHFI